MSKFVPEVFNYSLSTDAFLLTCCASSLHDNLIGDDGAVALGEALKTNTGLKAL